MKKEIRKELKKYECVMLTFGQIHPENDQCSKDFYHLIFCDEATKNKRIDEIEDIEFGSYSSDYDDYIYTLQEWESIWNYSEYATIDKLADEAMEAAGQYAKDYRGYSTGENLPGWITKM